MKDEYTCEDCGHGRWPYDDKLSCYDLEVQYMKWSSPLAIGPIAIAVIGRPYVCLSRDHCDIVYPPVSSAVMVAVSLEERIAHNGQ